MTNETVGDFPTITQEPYIAEHNYATRADEAHPIDDDIVAHVCDTKRGPAIIHYDLAMLQAVALAEIHPYDCDTETWIERQGDLHYYQAQSLTFYDVLSYGYDYFDAYVEIENAPELAECHTRQYLRDVHGYEGDFGGFDPTLCSAQNDEHSLREMEPDNAHYGFVDSRGLVIEEGTHSE